MLLIWEAPISAATTNANAGDGLGLGSVGLGFSFEGLGFRKYGVRTVIKRRMI